jgi:hypothetical protein
LLLVIRYSFERNDVYFKFPSHDTPQGVAILPNLKTVFCWNVWE